MRQRDQPEKCARRSWQTTAFFLGSEIAGDGDGAKWPLDDTIVGLGHGRRAVAQWAGKGHDLAIKSTRKSVPVFSAIFSRMRVDTKVAPLSMREMLFC